MPYFWARSKRCQKNSQGKDQLCMKSEIFLLFHFFLVYFVFAFLPDFWLSLFIDKIFMLNESTISNQCLLCKIHFRLLKEDRDC